LILGVGLLWASAFSSAVRTQNKRLKKSYPESIRDRRIPSANPTPKLPENDQLLLKSTRVDLDLMQKISNSNHSLLLNLTLA
jgi:hypothetical protein